MILFTVDKSPPQHARPALMRALLCGAAALAFGLATEVARAEDITFTFEGSLTQDPFGISQIGAPVSGRYTFDSAALDDIADSGSGSFTSTGPAFGFSAVVDGIAYAAWGDVNVGTQVGQMGLYLVTARAGALTLEISLQDFTGSAVAGDALPLAPPILTAFALREFRLFADDAEFTATLDKLQSVTPSVPEPGTAGLLLAGLGGSALFAVLRRHRTSVSAL